MATNTGTEVTAMPINIGIESRDRAFAPERPRYRRVEQDPPVTCQGRWCFASQEEANPTFRRFEAKQVRAPLVAE